MFGFICFLGCFISLYFYWPVRAVLALCAAFKSTALCHLWMRRQTSVISFSLPLFKCKSSEIAPFFWQVDVCDLLRFVHSCPILGDVNKV